MELDNKKLTTILIVVCVIVVIHISFTVWSYLQLRNKQGPTGPPGPRGPRGPPGRG